MIKTRLDPIKNPDFKHSQVNDRFEIHADRLQSFKSVLCRYNKKYEVKLEFSYSVIKDNYYTATRTA